MPSNALCSLAWCNIFKRTEIGGVRADLGQLLVNRHTDVVLQKRDFLTSVIHPCCSLIYEVSLSDSQGGAFIATLSC